MTCFHPKSPISAVGPDNDACKPKMSCSLKFPTMLISSSGEKHEGSVLPIVEVAGVDAGPAPDEALAGQALVWPWPPAAITGAQLIAHHPISSCTERGAVSHAHSPPKPKRKYSVSIPTHPEMQSECPRFPGTG